jgi:hypothetical protein
VNNDILWPVAQDSVQQVIAKDRRFPQTQEVKAKMHTWLAWQEEPGSFVPHFGMLVQHFSRRLRNVSSPFLADRAAGKRRDWLLVPAKNDYSSLRSA